MLKIIHAADVHLDTPYVRHEDALRARLQEAGREAFVGLIDLALREKAHALLIAGDLFDNDLVTVATERLLIEEMQRVVAAGVTVVYATGNHDPGRANYRAMQIDWPRSGFHLVGAPGPIKIALECSGETVGWAVAAGHQTPRETENLVAKFPPAPGPEPAVALLHAHVAAVNEAPLHEPYAPAALADFGGKGYAYWALGHIHARQTVADDPQIVYPGNLQGRQFGESGAKGAMVVEIESHSYSTARFRPLARVRWERLLLDDLADVRSITDIQASARAAFAHLEAGAAGEILPDQEWILRVELRGPCPLVDTLRSEDERTELADFLRDALGALDVEVRDTGVHSPVDLAEYRGHQHVLGLALELAEQARSDNDLLQSLVPTKLAAGEFDDQSERDAYLRELLIGLDSFAAEALLREIRS